MSVQTNKTAPGNYIPLYPKEFVTKLVLTLFPVGFTHSLPRSFIYRSFLIVCFVPGTPLVPEDIAMSKIEK